MSAQPDSPLDKIPPLRPPHAEIPPTFWERSWLSIVLGALALLALVGAGLVFWLWPKPPVIVPPGVLARQALEPLSRQPEDGQVLSRVSQVMRHYLAAAFGLQAGELTTAEFSHAIINQKEIGAPLSVPITNFLRQCDERKFAPGIPGAPLGAVPQALKLIERAEARRLELSAAASRPNPPK